MCQPKQPKAKYFLNCPGFVVGLSELPDCSIRVPTKFDSPDLIKDKKRLPLRLKNRVSYYIYDRRDYKFYKITAYKGEKFDGATIKLYCWLIGYPLQPEFLTGAVIHDKICRDHSLIGYKRRLSSELFYEFLVMCCVPKYKAILMREAVDLWQRWVWWYQDSTLKRVVDLIRQKCCNIFAAVSVLNKRVKEKK